MAERKSKIISLGEVLIKTDRNTNQPKGTDAEGNPLYYHLQLWLGKDGEDEAGVGEPSLVLKNGDYIHFKLITDEDKEAIVNNEKINWPEWKLNNAIFRAYTFKDEE